MNPRPLLAAALLACCSGCLEPLVSDALPPEAVQPADAVIPDIADNPAMMAQLEANLELPLHIPRVSAFAEGQPVTYWDFGPAPEAHVPIWVIVEPDPEGPLETPEGRFSPTGHPNVIDAIPGDPAYSPFWGVQLVPVTEAYAGEQLTSLEAISQAVRTGLAEPIIEVPMVVNCPVVLPGTTLDMGEGEEPGGLVSGYYRGHVVYYAEVGLVPFDGNRVLTQPLYHLRREGGEPLSEPHRGVDMNGDGDRLDTHSVFASAEGSHLVRDVELVVRAETPSIDTGEAALTAESELFTDAGEPDPSALIAIYPAGEGAALYNRPIAPEAP